MKKILGIIVSFALIFSLVGCGSGKVETPKVSSVQEAPKVEKISPIVVGTWKYYTDIPGAPSYKTWTLNFKEDSTYATEGDNYGTDINSKPLSHGDTWGKKGTYTVTGNNHLYLTWVNNKGKSQKSDLEFEIKEENGKKQLIFKDNNGEDIPAIIASKYYLIFIKQD